MNIEKLYEELDRLIVGVGKRITMFEEYIKSNNLEEDFEKFCTEYQKLEKHPLKDQIPKR